MRPARLTDALVLVAHGSRDPRAAAATEALARAVRRTRPGCTVIASYLDHAGPRPLDVLRSLPAGIAVTVVPLLLTAAYHGRVDLPAVIEQARDLPLSLTLAPVLGPVPVGPVPVGPVPVGSDSGGPDPVGPDPVGLVPSLLVDAVLRGLAGDPSCLFRAGMPPCGGPGDGLDGVVLAAAGTRDKAARETIGWAAAALSARLGLPCEPAYASGSAPMAGEAVARLRAGGAERVAMAAYFLAPGYLYDVSVRSAREAGAIRIAEPLGDAPELVRLVLSRVDQVEDRPLTNAA